MGARHCSAEVEHPMSHQLMNACDPACCRSGLAAGQAAVVWSVVADFWAVEWITPIALAGMLAREGSQVPR